MQLTFEQIKAITTGAARIEKHDGVVNFFRFTKAQEEFYKGYNDGFYAKTFAPAGVRFRFKTDSLYLNIKAFVTTVFASTRGYYSFDVKVNGNFIGAIDNYGNAVFEGHYAKFEFPLGEVDGTVDLGDGLKTVEVYFPYTVKVDLKEVNLSDGAVVEALPKREKLLCFGDSITHGHDSTRNCRHYTAQLADALDLDLYNKGIGGEVFQPQLAACREDFTPKYITVAYGINDWNKRNREEFIVNCREFYKTVSENYPDTQVFGITPIWVKAADEKQTAVGSYYELEDIIRECAKELPNVTVISGVNFIEHNASLFGDLTTHPGNEAFDQYFNSLYSEIKKHI